MDFRKDLEYFGSLIAVLHILMQPECLESSGNGEEKKGRGDETPLEKVKAAQKVHPDLPQLKTSSKVNIPFSMAFSGGPLGEEKDAG